MNPLSFIVVFALIIAVPVMIFMLVEQGRRLRDLERKVTELSRGSVSLDPALIAPHPTIKPPELPVVEEHALTEQVRSSHHTTSESLEQRIGQRALGWVAVVVLLFAMAFFVRYAFQNQWVGPLGRVTIGIVVGLALVVRGRSYWRRGWHVFSQMLTAAGVVLLYLSTFSAFGFYHLLPQRVAGVFLMALVAESALLADRYRAPAIALITIIGGLLTPMLMHSEHDQYQSLFVYLAVLNAGTIALLSRHPWPGIGTVALVGTQVLFWMWHDENMHPEKLLAASAFQFVMFAMYLAHAAILQARGRPRVRWEDAMRLVLNAGFGYWAVWQLLADEYRTWMGSLAMVMAVIYVAFAQWSWRARNRDPRLVLAAITTAVAFIAITAALEADMPWIGLAWAAEASVLWWFGLRVAAKPLRVMAAILSVMALIYVVYINAEYDSRPQLLLNRYALSSLATIGCFVASLLASRIRLRQLLGTDRLLLAIKVVACIVLIWFVVSVDLYDHFMTVGSETFHQLDTFRLAQMALSAWWSIYAGCVLAVGFKLREALLRWTALAIFAATVGKAFFVDLAGLDQLYRIVAFFVLAMLLGAAAWAYQRFNPSE